MTEFQLPQSRGSAAVPIIAPTDDASPVKMPIKVTSPSSKNSANRQRTCRNVIIHGFCKFEGKGCEFNHDLGQSNKESSRPATPESTKPKLRLSSPEFKPSMGSQSISIDAVKAPVFVPRNQTPQQVAMQQSYYEPQAQYSVEGSNDPFEPNRVLFPPSSEPPPSGEFSGAFTNSFSHFDHELDPMNPFAPIPISSAPPPTQKMLTDTGTGLYSASDHMYYYSGNNPYLRQPLQYNFYTGDPPYKHLRLKPNQRTIHSFFMDLNLWEDLQRKSEATFQTLNPSDFNLPTEIHVYHSLYPLDEQPDTAPKLFGYPTSVYKATCKLDNRCYALRRIEGFRTTQELALVAVESWRRIRHANIVSIREAFVTNAFGDHSLVLVYDYHPCSTTLFKHHFGKQQGGQEIIPERTLWSYICQLVSAIKTIHTAGLAARVIEPTKILLTGKNRIRLNCCGIFDIIQFDGGKNVALFQQEDFLYLARLIITLACNSPTATHNLPNSLEFMTQHYSADLKNFVVYLLSQPTHMLKNINDVITMIGPKILDEVDTIHRHNNWLERELGKEVINGRIVRLLFKMGFINERPEFDMDPSWSETGDRYLIKLFRDYVFHQVDEHGRAVLDMAHVISCLSKLDAGVDEKIMLMSRDEQSCLIVSYRELRMCVLNAYNELSAAAQR
ncbi:uncharacterized protein VTP21DRAFT_2518 [Calcarisporiella thermophila]|uniref:uncharacterized protein n=1 Tax=Calcarisporiella thermophila TaxID=911321 RepID=UPI003742585B